MEKANDNSDIMDLPELVVDTYCTNSEMSASDNNGLSEDDCNQFLIDNCTTHTIIKDISFFQKLNAQAVSIGNISNQQAAIGKRIWTG